MAKRIAILFHQNERRRWRGYAIAHMAKCWTEAGHVVQCVFGVDRVVPADLAILHVDLSVVPDEYLAFARGYPRTLNGAVADVRKSTFSRHLLRAGDAYDGQVIVKSDLNFGGLPEQLLRPGGVPVATQMANLWRSLVGARHGHRPSRFQTSSIYRIYPSLRDVPPSCFATPGLAVEQFLPEREDGLYWLRLYHFLGDRLTSVRIGSPDPVVKSHNKVRRIAVEPHPEIVAQREALGFDYGKFDYVIHDGRAILLDVNKTPGEGRRVAPDSMARLRYRAAGLYSYLP
jgi:hypothetical protein